LNARIPLASAALAVSIATFAGPAFGVSVPAPICGDVNNTGSLSPSDALAVLRASVGQPVALTCGQCPAALVYGTTEAVATSSEFHPDYLLGGPVEILQAMTMDQFGLISRTAGNHVKIALYTDDGGKPDSLVVGTPSTTLLAGSQTIEVPATEVPAGDYWIMAVYDADTPLPGDDEDLSTPVYFKAFTFSDPLPETFGVGTTYGGQPMPYAVKGIP
jgi:hypothetical protein